MRLPTFSSQRGAALLTALIILLILSVLGVTAASTGILQLKMSSNSQQQAAATEAAQSAINLMLLSANVGDDDSADNHIVRDSYLVNLAGYQEGSNESSDKNYKDLNAMMMCVAADKTGVIKSKNTIIKDGPCNGTTEWVVSDADDKNGGRPLRALARIFYRGDSERPSDCPNTDMNVNLACKLYEIEGLGWFDGNENGKPDDGETQVRLREWAVIRNRAAKPL